MSPTATTTSPTDAGIGLEGALDRALAFLAAHQLPHGELPIYRTSDRAMEGEATFHSSPYATAYTLHCLRFVDGGENTELARRARVFLAEEMEPPGVWRYYASRSDRLLPPDLDDTACAAAVLRAWDDRLALGLGLRLFLANRDGEGRFRTFLHGGDNNVCALVNANVLFFLGERPETRGAVAFLNRTVAEGREREASVYGVDDLAFYYVLARACAAGVAGLAASRQTVVERTLARRRDDGSFGDPLATALAAATLYRLGFGDPTVLGGACRSLVATQHRDGSWPRSAFYLDFGPGYYGSEELTTAFAVEALASSRDGSR